jgi:hypothetical protein
MTPHGPKVESTDGCLRRRVRERTIILLPVLFLLGGLSRYAEIHTRTALHGRALVTTTTALVGALLLYAGNNLLERRRKTPRTPLVLSERLSTLMLGVIGIGLPISLLTWSRHTLTVNASAVVLAVGVVCLAPRAERRSVLLAVSTLAGIALLVVGRALHTGFPPARAVYLSIVSGAVLNYGAAVRAFVAVIVAGTLTAYFYRNIPVRGLATEPRRLVLLLAPAPVCVLLTGLAVNARVLDGVDPWSLIGGVSALASVAALITLVRRTTPLIGAITMLAALLPAIVVTSWSHGALLTAPMRIGALFVIAAVLNLRHLLKRQQAARGATDGATLNGTDR